MKLREAKVWITHDLSKEDRQIQSYLRKKSGQARTQNKTTRIVGKNLFIDGTKFTYESLKAKESDTDQADESDLESVYDNGNDNNQEIKSNTNKGTTGNYDEDGSVKRKIVNSPSTLRTTRLTQKRLKDK